MFLSYVAVSVLALVLDYSTLLGMVRLAHYDPSLSAAVSYMVGALLHYGLSRRFVFAPGWLHGKRHGEFAAFMATSLVGTGITTLIIFTNNHYALSGLFWAKTCSVFVSFISTYFLRKHFVFATPDTVATIPKTANLSLVLGIFPTLAQRGRQLPAWSVAGSLIGLAAVILCRHLGQPWNGTDGGDGALFSAIAHNYLQYGIFNIHFGQATNMAPVSQLADLHYYQHHPPLLPLLIAASFAVFGEHEAAARLVPCAATLVSLIVFYRLSVRGFGKGLALLALFIFASYPGILFYGRKVGFEAVTLCLMLLAIASYIELLSKRTLAHALALGVFLLAALLSDWPAYFLSLAFAIHYAFYTPKHRWQWLVSSAFLLLPVLVFGWFEYQASLVVANSLTDLLHQGMAYAGLISPDSALAKTYVEAVLDFTPKQYFLRLSENMDKMFAYPILLCSLLGLWHIKKLAELPRFLIASTLFIGIANCVLFYRNVFFLELWIYYLAVPLSWLAALELQTLVGAGLASKALGHYSARRAWGFVVVLVLVGAAPRLMAFHNQQVRVLPEHTLELASFMPALAEQIKQRSHPDALIASNLNLPRPVLYYAQREIQGGVSSVAALPNQEHIPRYFLLYPYPAQQTTALHQQLLALGTPQEFTVQAHRFLWFNLDALATHKHSAH